MYYYWCEEQFLPAFVISSFSSSSSSSKPAPYNPHIPLIPKPATIDLFGGQWGGGKKRKTMEEKWNVTHYNISISFLRSVCSQIQTNKNK